MDAANTLVSGTKILPPGAVAPPLDGADDALLSVSAAAKAAGVDVRTLEMHVRRGSGPKRFKLSARCVVYRLSAIRRWRDERIVVRQ